MHGAHLLCEGCLGSFYRSICAYARNEYSFLGTSPTFVLGQMCLVVPIAVVSICLVAQCQADNSLVVLEIDSQQVCESGFDEEPELHWQEDKKAKDEQLWGMCRSIKHVFQRTARECPDVKFLALDVSSINIVDPYPVI